MYNGLPGRPVILRESGVSSTLQPLDSITGVSEYWIARRSLSSGAHSRDPLAGDDRQVTSPLMAGFLINCQTAKMVGVRILATRIAPELLYELPSKDRGRRESRVLAAPAASRAEKSTRA